MSKPNSVMSMAENAKVAVEDSRSCMRLSKGEKVKWFLLGAIFLVFGVVFGFCEVKKHPLKRNVLMWVSGGCVFGAIAYLSCAMMFAI